jgi:hypothetical protein
MMIEVLTNGSRLSSPPILGLLTSRPPHRVTLSVYGATEASYDGLTQRRGSYKSFIKGLTAAREAGIPLDLSVVITTDNAHEVDAMHAMAGRLGIRYRDYRNMSPTIYGGGESLPSQSLPHLTRPEPFTGCDAGHTSSAAAISALTASRPCRYGVGCCCLQGSRSAGGIWSAGSSACRYAANPRTALSRSHRYHELASCRSVAQSSAAWIVTCVMPAASQCRGTGGRAVPVVAARIRARGESAGIPRPGAAAAGTRRSRRLHRASAEHVGAAALRSPPRPPTAAGACAAARARSPGLACR